MDKKELIKKYWFLALIALGLVVFFFVYSIQAFKNRTVYVSPKEENGQSIVYTLNGKNYFADEMYEDLYEGYEIPSAYFKWSMDVINEAVPTTDELTQKASNYAQTIQYYNDETTIANYLIRYGYANGIDDIYQYALDMVKADEIYYDFYTKNFDAYAPNVIEQNKPKKISHILIKVADVTDNTDSDGNSTKTANMTADEQNKLNDVLESLKTDDFETVAKEYSDDTTKENGGYLGIYDEATASNQFVKEFADAANSLEYGEVSEPILSQYGYHIIKVEEPTKDELKSDRAFISSISSFYSFANVKALNEKANELGFEIVNQDLKDLINEYLDNADKELASYESTEVNE